MEVDSEDRLVLTETPSLVRQDNFSPAKGNALQACIASLFHLKLNDVPNFIELDVGYEQGIRDFLASRSNIRMRKVPLEQGCSLMGEEEESKGKLCLLRGKSPRGEFGHVVVAKVCENVGFEMVHDPHPDDTFLDKTERYGWCMLFDE
mmetsp:Transcript_14877/g.19533  ORF Transcript_14877/g.19533 Transcript_14877/m.19533 type:complete len:148 (+) Transcript_14877:93-536(+)